MATLAATAAPKLSVSEGAKGEKSRNEIDKIVKMAGQFYQDQAEASLSVVVVFQISQDMMYRLADMVTLIILL